jgi:hypothetical protein
MPKSKSSQGKRAQTIAALPPELRPVFDDLAADYEAAALACTGVRFVKYDVIAELVRSGWQKMPVHPRP